MDNPSVLSVGTQNFTFTPPVVIAGTAAQDAEPPKVVRLGDAVFILWHEFPETSILVPDIFLSRSTNRGATFQPRMNLSNSPARDSRFEDIAVSRSGSNTRVYVVWIEDFSDVLFRRDRTNDGTFSNAVKLNDTVGGSNAANARVAASGDNVFVVWEETPPTDNNPDIFFARSTDAGNSFRDKQNISKSSNNDSIDPAIALLADNRVIVAWRDNSGGDHEIFYARGQ